MNKNLFICQRGNKTFKFLLNKSAVRLVDELSDNKFL